MDNLFSIKIPFVSPIKMNNCLKLFNEQQKVATQKATCFVHV